MAKKNFYITTPIYYINDIPHIGHAYTSIVADLLSRYYRSQGKTVFFLTGVDEHGAKIAEAAEKTGEEPQKFVDSLNEKFLKTWENLNINYSGYFRTTDPRHGKIVQDFVRELKTKGFIEKRKYQGLYCIGCERFYLPDELIDGKCPDHNREPVLHSEENYFFLISKLEKRLLKKIENDEIVIKPKARKNEIIGKIKQGLDDISISRETVKWGVAFPDDPTQTVYVWVDALLNYYSATKIFKDKPIWPPDIQLMAKDIFWFHAVIWPALLMAVGIELPKTIFAHGFFTINGKKMSKSLGNVLEPNVLAEKYGADALRYALLREFPFGEDGDISEEKIALRYQSDLANELGNLLLRTITMVNKYQIKVEDRLPEKFDPAIGEKITTFEFDIALKLIWQRLRKGNQLIETSKPWELAKTDQSKLAKVINVIYGDLYQTAIDLEPFMPQISEKMLLQLKNKNTKPLFPRVEEK